MNQKFSKISWVTMVITNTNLILSFFFPYISSKQINLINYIKH